MRNSRAISYIEITKHIYIQIQKLLNLKVGLKMYFIALNSLYIDNVRKKNELLKGCVPLFYHYPIYAGKENWGNEPVHYF